MKAMTKCGYEVVLVGVLEVMIVGQVEAISMTNIPGLPSPTLADMTKIGGAPGFGYKQLTGPIFGIIILVMGVIGIIALAGGKDKT